MTIEKMMHVWMPDGRSLCDRRAAPGAVRTPDHVREAIEAPACGICLLLVGRLRREAAVILAQTERTAPQRASEAWSSLRGTRWERYFDLAAFDEKLDSVDANTRYDAILNAVDPAVVKELADEWVAVRARGLADDALGFKGP